MYIYKIYVINMSYRIWRLTNKTKRYVKLIPRDISYPSTPAFTQYQCPSCGEWTDRVGCEHDKNNHIRMYTRDAFMEEARKIKNDVVDEDDALRVLNKQ